MKLGVFKKVCGVFFEGRIQAEDVIVREGLILFNRRDFVSDEIGHETLRGHPARRQSQNREERGTADDAVDIGQHLLVAFTEDLETLEVEET